MVVAATAAALCGTAGWRIWPNATVVTNRSWRRTERGMFKSRPSFPVIHLLCGWYLEGRLQLKCNGGDMMVGFALDYIIRGSKYLILELPSVFYMCTCADASLGKTDTRGIENVPSRFTFIFGTFVGFCAYAACLFRWFSCGIV